jgi:hypothetical protein
MRGSRSVLLSAMQRQRREPPWASPVPIQVPTFHVKHALNQVMARGAHFVRGLNDAAQAMDARRAQSAR